MWVLNIGETGDLTTLEKLNKTIPLLEKFNGCKIIDILEELKNIKENDFWCFVVHISYKPLNGMISFNIDNYSLTDMHNLNDIFNTDMLYYHLNKRINSFSNNYKSENNFTSKKNINKKTISKTKKESDKKQNNETVEFQQSLF